MRTDRPGACPFVRDRRRADRPPVRPPRQCPKRSAPRPARDWKSWSFLINLDVGVAQDLRPLDAVGLDELGELFGRAYHRLEHVGRDDALAERRIIEQLLHLGVDLEDGLARRA